MKDRTYKTEVTREEQVTVDGSAIAKHKQYVLGQTDRRAGLPMRSNNGAYMDGWHEPNNGPKFVTEEAVTKLKLPRPEGARIVTVNKEQRLYVIPSGDGYSCLGFDVCKRRADALAAELSVTLLDVPVGSLELYGEYMALCEKARQRNAATGWRSQSELTPELIGLEGKRVEVTHQWESTGRTEVSKFWVGKSMGFIPCHLEIEKRGDDGGGAVCLGKILSVKVL